MTVNLGVYENKSKEEKGKERQLKTFPQKNEIVKK